MVLGINSVDILFALISFCLINSSISPFEYFGPKKDPFCESLFGSTILSFSKYLYQPISAAPRAPPASPAAGCIQIFSKEPLRNSFPFATQLSATPPASVRFFNPVSL